MLKNSIDKLTAFRKTIHELIPFYRDATLDLIDALSTNKNAQSVTQLTDNQFFRRQYNSLTKVIHYFLVSNDEEEQVNHRGFINNDDIGIKWIFLIMIESTKGRVKAQ